VPAANGVACWSTAAARDGRNGGRCAALWRNPGVPAAALRRKGREEGEGKRRWEVEEGGQRRRRRADAATATRSRHAVAPRQRETGRAKRREEGVRSWMEKLRLGYIFASVDLEEKRGKHRRSGKKLTRSARSRSRKNPLQTMMVVRSKIQWRKLIGVTQTRVLRWKLADN
jgi:hypothetical protein